MNTLLLILLLIAMAAVLYVLVRGVIAMANGKVEYSISLPEGCEGLFVPTARHVNPVLDGKPVTSETLMAAGRHLITFAI